MQCRGKRGGAGASTIPSPGFKNKIIEYSPVGSLNRLRFKEQILHLILAKRPREVALNEIRNAPYIEFTKNRKKKLQKQDRLWTLVHFHLTCIFQFIDKLINNSMATDVSNVCIVIS